jgi:chromosomal replication initiation ATPase DnaA
LERQLRLSLDRPESLRREDFVVSATNRDAVKLIDAWPSWPGGCLALIGPEGAGKSHLALSWAAQVKATVLSAEDHDGLSLLSGRPVLYDDADRDPERRDEMLFHLINMAGETGGGLLLTGRSAPAGWSVGLPDLRSRLNALTVAQIHEPDDAILVSMLRKFFRERNILPAEDIFPYLVRRIERSAPRAREIVRRLDERADAERRPVSRALARQILETDLAAPDLFD